MRRLALLVCSSLLVLAGCNAGDDGAVTDDSAEINEGRGSLERLIDPPIAAPKSELIGAKMLDVLAEAKGTATALAPSAAIEGCTTTRFKDAKTKQIVAERVECKRSEVLRFLAADGTTTAEHADLNKDGKVDRFSGEEGAVASFVDTNFDGKIDVVVERVEKVKDFSMEGYDEVFPKSRFLFRVREDRNRDGKLDFEKLTARGALPKAAD